jgi:hypothetical protein
LDYFSARFESKNRYMIPLHIFSVINVLITHLPILIMDVVGLVMFTWGS